MAILVIHSVTASLDHRHVRLYETLTNLKLHPKFILAEPPVKTDPCNPSPCGANAQCVDGVCSCLPEYQGDPYRGCRPECVLNTDCAKDKACIRNKCIDPCPGTCGQNANCVVVNHIPMCSCSQGFTGNAFVSCNPVRGGHFLNVYHRRLHHLKFQCPLKHTLAILRPVAPTVNVEKLMVKPFVLVCLDLLVPRQRVDQNV